MNIHEKINQKGLVEYFNTPSLRIVNGLIEAVPTKGRKAINEYPLMMISLRIQGNEAWNQTISGGSYYCHDCSTDRREPVYHFSNGSWNAFCSKWSKKYGEILNKIQKEGF